MADTTSTQASGTNQAVGKAFIIYGKVKAVSEDGATRVLSVNSPIFAFDRIITEGDGSVSIMLDGPPPTQLDIGRMSDIVIDEDVYAGVAPEDVAEATADAEQIQQALLEGGEEIELEATAAGGAAGAGGGHPIVSFDLTGEEVTPGSGAETTGLTGDAVDPLDGNAIDDQPTAGESFAMVDDEGLAGGIEGGIGDEVVDPDDDGNEATFSGVLAHDFGGDGPGFIGFAGMNGQTAMVGTEEVTYSWDAGTSTLTAVISDGDRADTPLFEVQVNPLTGEYTVTLLDNVLHESLDGEEGDNTENDATATLTYTVSDSDGDTANGTLAVTFDDDTPELLGDEGEPEEPDGQDVVAMASSYTGIPGPGEGGNVLVNNLGGPNGFGENFLAANDDGSTGFIDVTSIFTGGMNLFGQTYNGFYINNNGNITFESAMGTYTPFAITGATSNPMIAPFFADVDTRGADGNVSPGGNSTGSNLVWYDLDEVNGVITITWDDVGFYSQDTSLVNGFQLRIFDQGDGDFGFEFRYENIDWTTGDASGGTDGLGGVIARAGWTAGDGVNYYELPQAGDQAGMLGLETTSNPSTSPDGNWVFNVIGGEITVGGGSSDTVTVEDEKMTGGNDEDDGGLGVVNGTIVDNVNWGADDFGSVVQFTVGEQSFEAGTTVYWDQYGNFMGEGLMASSTGPALMMSVEVVDQLPTPAASLIVNSDGTYTYTLLDNMLMGQDDQGEQTDVLDTVAIVGQDADGDEAPAVNVTLQVTDDMPELYVEGGSDTVTVEDEKMEGGIDEDDGGVSSVDGTIVDNVSWGADGFASATGFSVGQASFDVNTTVYWDEYGNFLGTEGEGAAASLLVNSNGTYTYTLLDNMLLGQDDQGEQTDVLDTVSITGQDADGDLQAVDVTLQVTDDMPVADIVEAPLIDGEVPSTVTVDETDGVQDDDTTDPAVSALFGGLTGTSSDLTTAQYAQGYYSLVDTSGSSYGADEEGGTTVVSLSIAADGTDSGLETTDGTQIFLYKSGDLVVGRIGTEAGDGTDTADPSGAIAFAVAIDADDGTVSLAQYASVTNPTGGSSHDETVDLTGKISAVVTVTDGDGDIDTDSTDIGDQIYFSDDGPSVTAESGAETYSFTAEYQNVGVAGYNNSYGYYIKDGDGNPTTGEIIWANVKVASGPVTVEGYPPEQVGFFIIPDGGGQNSGLADGEEVYFQEVSPGVWQAYETDTDTPLTGTGANIFFDNAALNVDRYSHVQDNEWPGNQNWEDLLGSTDSDYEDVNVNVTWNAGLKVDESDFDTDDTKDFSTYFNIEGGADGLESVVYTLGVAAAGVDSGLIDSESGNHVFLFVENGEVVGREGTDATAAVSGDIVLTVSVDGTGNVTLDQARAVMHATSDPDEIITLADAGSVTLTATATDGDGDTAADTIDIGTLVRFGDDAPTAADDSDSVTEDDNTTATGNVLTGIDVPGGDENATDGTADDAGADGGPAVTWVRTGDIGDSSTPVDAGVSLAGDYGTLTLNSDGSYEYVLDNDDEGVQSLDDGETLTDTFTYSMRDADGDTSMATLTITINGADEPVLIVGSGDDDEAGSEPLWTVPDTGSGEIAGAGGDDILIGDPGGAGIGAGDTANIVFVLDTSGSMVGSRLNGLKAAVNDALADLQSYEAENVRVHIIEFSYSASPVGTYNLTSGGVDDAGELAAAVAAVNGLTAGGLTNYAAALAQADTWISGAGPHSGADMNNVVFVSDGSPTTGGSFADEVSSILTGSDFMIEAVGINVGDSALEMLDQVEGSPPGTPGHVADNVTSPEQLSAIIGELSGGQATLDPAGDDTIDGG